MIAPLRDKFEGKNLGCFNFEVIYGDSKRPKKSFVIFYKFDEIKSLYLVSADILPGTNEGNALGELERMAFESKGILKLNEAQVTYYKILFMNNHEEVDLISALKIKDKKDKKTALDNLVSAMIEWRDYLNENE